MATGIYQLVFSNKSVYIGQAQDIQARWRQHSDKFKRGTATQKMQAAYNNCGMPAFQVILECHKDYLDIMESYYINIINQYSGCLNTSIPKLDPNIDYEMLIRNDLLKYSATDMINESIRLTKDNTQLREQQSYQYAKAVLAEGKDQNEARVKELIETSGRLQQALNRLNRRGLLQRIFNYD